MKLQEIIWHNLEMQNEKPILFLPVKDTVGIISLGKCEVYNALAYFLDEGKKLSSEINLLKDSAAFYLVRIPLSIRPREDSTVKFVQMDVEIESENDNAVCWSMYPEMVEQEIKLNVNTGLTAGLKLEIATLGTTTSESQEFVVYQPRIVAYGIGQTDPAWELEAVGKPLRGIQVFTMVVKAAKKSPVRLHLIVGADIIFNGTIFNLKSKRDQNPIIQTIVLA